MEVAAGFTETENPTLEIEEQNEDTHRVKPRVDLQSVKRVKTGCAVPLKKLPEEKPDYNFYDLTLLLLHSRWISIALQVRYIYRKRSSTAYADS